VKTNNHGSEIKAPETVFQQQLDAQQYEWARDLYTCFGPQGVIALGFWAGSLLSELIRDDQKTFPLLEIVGSPGSGKTTLVEFLWKLLDREDYEGFDPEFARAEQTARQFHDTLNAPLVLLESPPEIAPHSERFHWELLKLVYNGLNPFATTGQRFKGAVVIVANAPRTVSPGMRIRTVRLHLRKTGRTDRTIEAAKNLERIPASLVNSFVQEVCSNGESLMNLITVREREYSETLANKLGSLTRPGKNHAQMMALVDCLGPDGLNLLPSPLIAGAHEMLTDMARECIADLTPKA